MGAASIRLASPGNGNGALWKWKKKEKKRTYTYIRRDSRTMDGKVLLPMSTALRWGYGFADEDVFFKTLPVFHWHVLMSGKPQSNVYFGIEYDCPSDPGQLPILTLINNHTNHQRALARRSLNPQEFVSRWFQESSLLCATKGFMPNGDLQALDCSVKWLKTTTWNETFGCTQWTGLL